MLDTQNLVKSVDGKILVDDISFLAEPGEIVAIIGPNGAGKSTLLKILATLIWPTSGSFSFQNRKVDEKSSDWYLSAMGTNLSLPKGEDARSCLELLESRLVYGEVTHVTPANILQTAGLLEKAHIPLSKLSTGMRSRLALGLALANQPELLLLDEPTTGIDASGVEGFVEIIRSATARGTTTILVSHDFPLVSSLANRIFFMNQGSFTDSCVKCNKYDAFLKKYSTLINAQVKK